jgi:hypothetical protein
MCIRKISRFHKTCEVLRAGIYNKEVRHFGKAQSNSKNSADTFRTYTFSPFPAFTWLINRETSEVLVVKRALPHPLRPISFISTTYFAT